MSQSNKSDIRILVVDDEMDMEYLIQQKYRQQILNKTYRFEFAYSGLEALSKIKEYPDISIILTDIKMPRLDGLTLLTKLRELNKPDLKTIVISAYGDLDNIRVAMNRGAFDFIIKPVDFDDLEITINKTIEEIELIRRTMAEHDKWISMQTNLAITRKIQESILPKIFPPFPEQEKFDIYASMVAARETGGDFFDFFMIDASRVGFVVGDVSGKGIYAVIFMAICRTLIRATGMKGVSAGECMGSVNDLLCRESASSMFVTVFYGILDFVTGEVEYVNAGHTSPYLMTSGGISRIGSTGGTALGIAERISFQTGNIRMNPGDRLFLFTDGITGSINAEGTTFGTAKLESLLNRHIDDPVETIIREMLTDVTLFLAATPQPDDITLLAITFRGQEF